MKNHNLIEVIEFCKDLQLDADIVGRWIWLQFDAIPPAELRTQLKDFGFRWIRKRDKWAHNCGHPCRAGMQNPYHKYSVKHIKFEEAQAVA